MPKYALRVYPAIYGIYIPFLLYAMSRVRAVVYIWYKIAVQFFGGRYHCRAIDSRSGDLEVQRYGTSLHAEVLTSPCTAATSNGL